MKRIFALSLSILFLAACARSTPRPSSASTCAPGFVQGNYAYVGFGNAFVVLDVSNPASPARAGAWALPGPVTDVCLIGSTAYVSHASNYDPSGAYLHGGMRIIDISNPAKPAEVSYYLYEDSFPTSVAVASDYAYLTDWAGLQVVDISRPARPRRVGFLAGQGYQVAAAGGYAYVTWEGCSMRSPCNGKFRIVNVSDPAALSEAAVFNYPKVAVSAVEVAGRYAYLVVGGLRIFDVSSPTSPAEVAFLASAAGFPHGLAVAGDHAYYLDYSQTLNAPVIVDVDVSNRAAPVTAGQWPLSPATLSTQNIALAGRYAFVTANGCLSSDYSDCGNFLLVVDVSAPAAPAEVGHYFEPYPVPPPFPSPAP